MFKNGILSKKRGIQEFGVAFKKKKISLYKLKKKPKRLLIKKKREGIKKTSIKRNDCLKKSYLWTCPLNDLIKWFGLT